MGWVLTPADSHLSFILLNTCLNQPPKKKQEFSLTFHMFFKELKNGKKREISAKCKRKERVLSARS
jgi:hypothetical protein